MTNEQVLWGGYVARRSSRSAPVVDGWTLLEWTGEEKEGIAKRRNVKKSMPIHRPPVFRSGYYPTEIVRRLPEPNGQPLEIAIRNSDAFAFLDDKHSGTRDRNQAPFGTLIKELFALRQWQERMHEAGVYRALEITKPYSAAPGTVAKRLRQAHELWAEKSTFRRPTDGSWAAKEKGKGKGKEIGPPSEEVLEKELRFTALPPNSTFGFSRVSGIVRAPTGSRSFLEEFAKVHTVQKDPEGKWHSKGTMTWKQHTAAVKRGRETQPPIRDAIAPFLKSNMFRESYERAGLASRLGEDVHARILLRCVAADTRSRWTNKTKDEESVMVTEQPAVHLVQHLFPANEIPRVMFASMRPTTKKRTPLADEVARLESGLWNLIKIAFPNWRFVGCEYDALWPHGLFLTSGSGSGGGRSRGPSSSVAASAVAVSVCPSAKRSYPFRGASLGGWRFLKTRIDAIVVDQQSGELVLIDYKTQIGESTQDDLASVSHILQVVTNAYVLYACSGIVVDTCALLYTNRRGVSRAVTFPFRQQLATKHSFVQRSLQATFSALPSVHVDRHYVFEAGLGAEWSLFGILDPLHESLPHLQPSMQNRGQTPFAGVLGPSMQLIGEKEGKAQPPKYGPIPEFQLLEAVHKTKRRLRVYLWAHDPLVRQTAGKDVSKEQKRLPPTAALLSGFPATATTRLRRRPTSPPKRKRRVSPRIKRLKTLGGKGRGKESSTASQISSLKERTESGEEPSEIPTSEGEDFVAAGSETWSTQAVVGLATDKGDEDKEKKRKKEEELKHQAARRALNRAVQLAGEELVKHPIVAEKSARFLRAQLRVFAGPADRSGINPPLATGKAYSPTEQKLEAAIRAINRFLNTQVLAKLSAERALDKSPRKERPHKSKFPHLSQRAWWSLDLLTYARDEVPSILSRIKLHLEKAHRTASGYGSA